ncbi:nucleoporin NUP35 isoform X1 [Vicugna pacos]|uniref:Nucleoporin NUP35 n=2 Tax=Camelidae TaxID=9835 RepID=A0ABM5D8X2_VICPA
MNHPLVRNLTLTDINCSCPHMADITGSEPMMLGSPTSPKPGVNAQFLPGFLMGDLPAPVTPQPRSISGPSVGVMEMRSPLLAGGSPPQPVVPAHKDKSGAPPVRSIYDDISSPGLGSTPLTSRRQANISVMQSPLVGVMTTTPGTEKVENKQDDETAPVVRIVFEDKGQGWKQGDQTLGYCINPGQSMFSPANIGQPRKTTLSPAQMDPFYTQGDSLTSEDHLDDTWVTVFGFPQASASYILLQFAQYGNILKHVMSNTGNWMHIRYQSKLQARKALSKDGRIFGESIMIGVKPCIDKSVMENSDRCALSSPSVAFTPPIKTLGTPTQPGSTPRISTMRPLATAYKASTSDYQVISDRQTPKKDESLISKAMEYMFGW